MALKINIISNYISQVYVAIISIVMIPVYIKYMGVEAYGLVAFYAILQVCFNLLDMGLTPTIARETARYHGGALSVNDYRRLVRALEGIFIAVAIVGSLSLFLGAKYIAQEWLKVKDLPVCDVIYSLKIVAIIVALRWSSGIYRGIISGSERLVWLGVFNVVSATLRFVAVIPFIIYSNNKILFFFSFQLLVATVEFLLLIYRAYCILPTLDLNTKIIWEWTPLRPILKFSLSIAITSAIWVMITQLDKLILSNILMLEEYGRFSLAVLVASGVLLFSAPISSAITPHMAKLEAENKQEEQIIIYRKSTQLVAILAGSAAITLALFSKNILWAWTGSITIADEVSLVLSYYVLGNGVLVIAAFPSYLQYAKGNMQLHLIGNIIFALIFIPLIIFAASKYGIEGAGLTWLVMNCISFLAWIPFVHNKFSPGLNLNWYSIDTIPIIIAIFIACYLFKIMLPPIENRIEQIFVVGCVGICMVIVGLFSASFTRELIIRKLSKNIC
jgi:O-antigen/teichoic acid export membrane protein